MGNEIEELRKRSQTKEGEKITRIIINERSDLRVRLRKWDKKRRSRLFKGENGKAEGLCALVEQKLVLFICLSVWFS